LIAYLDASVLIPTLVEETDSADVDAYILSGTERWLISEFAAAEVASGLSRMVRMGRLDSAGAIRRLDDFETWRAADAVSVDFQPSDARLAYTYVRRFELALRAPDALHLAMARRLGATMVTLDRRMARAATELGVAVDLLGPAPH